MDKDRKVSRVGRPRKDKSEKVEYQHIAVHASDYQKFLEKSDNTGLKKVELFHFMVEQFDEQPFEVKSTSSED